MSTQHTPGPWISGHGKTKEMGLVLGVGRDTEPNWTPVCVVSPIESVNETDRANAYLIAAAPELLEALQMMLKHPGTITAQLVAQAAIAKATQPAAQRAPADDTEGGAA